MGRLARSVPFACPALCALLALSACGGGTTPPDGGPSEAGADAASDARVDGGGDAGTGGCVGDLECSDGVYCNGAERCAHGAAGADARGCVAAMPATPCLASQTCDEARRMCITACGSGGGGDADGDGHVATSCGGDDCDDADANRYPGGREVCDATNHDEDCDPTTFGFRDGDSDAYADATCCNVDMAGGMHCGDDCNDSRPNVHPGLPEACDGLDNDCNGMVDEGVGRTFYPDVDGDGFGDSSAPMSAWMTGCVPPAHFSETGGDCNDADSAVHPGALEQCDAAMVDENCDGTANPATLCSCAGDVTRMCMMLGGVCSAGTERCIGGSWGLCSIGPTPEVCNGLDDNCNGMVDEMLSVTCYPDGDNDGFAAAGALPAQTCPVPGRDGFAGCPPNQTNRAPVGATAIDCNDSNSTVSPGATELCDVAMVDENCDGVANPPTLCMCTDGDTRPCTAPGSCGAGNQTCSGGHFSACSVNPVAESCNGIDDNCNGLVDEGLTVDCYADNDNDGYAAAGAALMASCPVMGRAYVGGCPTGQTNLAPGAGTTDCNDASSVISPSAIELCDMAMVDENCDGMANPASLCACSGSASRACPQMGVCMAGTQTCGGGSWGLCSILPVTEICNGVDDNCNGSTDEGLTVTCYVDADNDGYAAVGATTAVRCPDSTRSAVGGCPSGLTIRTPTGANVDCDDTNAGRAPGAAEVCNGLDDNCNGMVDEGSTIPCYGDADGDGYAPAGSTVMQRCADLTRTAVGTCPVGTTNRAAGAGATDCNDAAAPINPAAVELCDAAMVDENCDGVANPPALCACSGTATRACMAVGACAAGTQTCASGSWALCTIGPVPETCNGIDDNCNGPIDEGVTITCYPDGDNDGYPPSGAAAVQRCSDPTRPSVGGCPTGTTFRAPVAATIDCNDASATVSPGVTEVCNGIDDNCVAGIDELLTIPCFTDGDGDTFAPAGATVMQVCGVTGRPAVAGCPLGMTNRAPAAGTDCNDTMSGVSPAAPEVCNGVDDNCNAVIDEGVRSTFYRDADGDGYGATAMSMSACSAPAGYVAANGDCNDASLGVHPGASELCNGVDDNCDGMIDEGLIHTYYRDVDGDLYGTATTTTMACSPPAGYVVTVGDCNDAASNVHPGATEVCNGVDDDCDTVIDGAGAAAQCAGSNPFATNVTSWACTAAACTPTCAANFGNCNASPIDGCEVDLRSTPAHCGLCTTACGVGAGCNASACDVVVDVVAGSSNTCVRYQTAGGMPAGLVCWGANGHGELANTALTDSGMATPITDLPVVTMVEIARHVDGLGTLCAMAPGNQLFCWGLNNSGQIGDGTKITRYTPQLTSTGATTNLALGAYHSCRRYGGSADACWGNNALGELGLNPATTPELLTIPGGTITATTVDTSASGNTSLSNSCSVQTGGTILCWGSGMFGRLGNGGAAPFPAYSFTPVNVTVGAANATDIELGSLHTCFLRSTGAAACFGRNAYGELGDGLLVHADCDTVAPGAQDCASAPVTVGGAHVFAQLATGEQFTCGRTTANQLYCWGYNGQGALGTGAVDFATHPTPVLVPLASVVDVTAGRDHVCAVVAGGAVYCWGNNSHGQLGNGTVTFSATATPTRVVGL